MRMPRVFVALDLHPDAELSLQGDAARHLLKVLRLGPGAALRVFNGDGREFEAEILDLAHNRPRVRLGAAGPAEPEPPLHIGLGIGVSKGERMDWVIQKSVELGVSAITPLWTERTVVKLDRRRLERRLQHWRGVVIAACEQSGRRRLPVLQPPQALAEWLGNTDCGHRLMLDHRATCGLTALPPPATPALALLTGPEGGLSATERSLAENSGFQGVRLGPRILRTETAPLAALTAIQLLWGDLG